MKFKVANQVRNGLKRRDILSGSQSLHAGSCSTGQKVMLSSMPDISLPQTRQLLPTQLIHCDIMCSDAQNIVVISITILIHI